MKELATITGTRQKTSAGIPIQNEYEERRDTCEYDFVAKTLTCNGRVKDMTLNEYADVKTYTQKMAKTRGYELVFTSIA